MPPRPAAWLTDVEGRWDKLASFCAGNPLVSLEGDALGGERLRVAPGAVFVFGGDTVDRGPAGRRILRALVAAKRAQPGQVVLLAGNRDINKLRLSRELRGAPPARTPPELRQGPRPALLRWIFAETMGAAQAFGHRLAELAAADPGAGGEEVVESYLADVAEGGAMRDYLAAAQLAFREGETLFLHGGVTAQGFGVAPGAERTDDADAWIAALNAFYAAQLHGFLEDRGGAPAERPAWAELVAYQAPLPGTRLNQASVVYARPTDEDGNPLLPPQPVIAKLRAAGLRRVVVGHTPCGDCPAVLRDGEFELVLADNSYGRVETGSQVLAEDGRLRVAGLTELDGGERAEVRFALAPGDPPPLGLCAGGGGLVKARLARGDFLLFRSSYASGRGYTVTQQAVGAAELERRGLGPADRQA